MSTRIARLGRLFLTHILDRINHRSGVLFHHETPTKDWFYDLMKPYQHYVPIRLDLADLRGKFEWAEANQARAKEISAAGKEFSKFLFSEGYMTSIYNELFVDYLGTVVESYISHDSTWKESSQRYADNGFKLTQVAFCRATRCFTNVRDDVERAFPHVAQGTGLSHPAPLVIDLNNKQSNTLMKGDEGGDSPEIQQSPSPNMDDMSGNKESNKQLSSSEDPTIVIETLTTEVPGKLLPFHPREIDESLDDDSILIDDQYESKTVDEAVNVLVDESQSINRREVSVPSPDIPTVSSFLSHEGGQSDSIPPQKARIDSVPPPEVPVETIPPQEARVDFAPPAEVPMETIPPQEARVDFAPPPEVPMETIPPQEARVDSAPLPDAPVETIPPQEARVDSIQPHETLVIVKNVESLMGTIPPQEARVETFPLQEARVETRPSPNA